MIRALNASLVGLRDALDRVYAVDTAQPGSNWSEAIPSIGHCAATACMVRALCGGDFVSANVAGVSHWFNRIGVEGRTYDIDLTGDQFGRARVQVVRDDGPRLYDGIRVRSVGDVNEETWRRYRLLCARMEAA